MSRRSTVLGGLTLSAFTLLAIAGATVAGVVFKSSPPSHAAAAAYYVSPNGSDSNSGTQQAPFRTLQHAAAVASSPGATVHVAPGTYATSSSIYTKFSGTASAPIVFVSDTPWAAKITVSGDTMAWYNGGDFVHNVGFDNTNTNSASNQGIDNGGSHTLFAGNHIHDIAQWGCPSYGAAINDSNYSGSGDDEIGNFVERIGPSSSCNFVHGIYHANAGGHVWNNIAANTSGYGIHGWHADTGVEIANNLVFGNRLGGIILGAGDAPGGVTTDNMVITNNIVENNGGYGIREYGAVGTHNQIDHNDVYGNASGAYSLLNGAATNGQSTDPQFVNWQTNGSGDYHLRSTSPLIGAGTSLGAPDSDMAGMPRPSSDGYDMGPYQTGSSQSAPAGTPTPGPTGTPAATSTPAGTSPMFSDTFESDSVGSLPSGWNTASGTWTVVQDGSHVLKQTNTSGAVQEILAGNSGWSDYAVSFAAKAPGGSGEFGVAGRRHDVNNTYMLVLENQRWILGKKVAGSWTTLKAGSFAYTAGTWYTFGLTFSGTTITATINQATLAQVTDSSFASGGFSLRTDTTSEFDSVQVTAR